MRLIGFSGLARSGKDEAANALVEAYGYQKIAFADKLREFLWEVNPYMKNRADNTYLPLQEVFSLYGGWEQIKDSPYYVCYRQLIQNIGTEAGRGILGKHVWIDALDNQLVMSKNYAVPDIRFKNEEDYIRSRGGLTVRIWRPGLGKINDHASEQLSFKSQHVIINDGSVKDLHQKVVALCDQVGEYS